MSQAETVTRVKHSNNQSAAMSPTNDGFAREEGRREKEVMKSWAMNYRQRIKLQTRNNPSPQFYYKFTHILRLCAKGELLQIKKSEQEHYMNTNHWIISSYCDHNSFLTFLSGYMWNSAVLPKDKTLN